MKRFVSKSCLFALVCLAALSLLFALPMDKRVNFHFIKGDCYAHGEWFFERIGRKNGANFLFLGSSRTIYAVDERVFETSFFEKNGLRKTALNLGYCRLGSNLPHVFLKEFLKKYRPEGRLGNPRDRGSAQPPDVWLRCRRVGFARKFTAAASATGCTRRRFGWKIFE